MKPSDEPSKGLLARPGQLLIEHLNNTAGMCSQIREKRLSIVGEADGDILGDAAFLTGFAHDLGKATSYFQAYLRENDEKKKRVLKNKDETHHSLLSSLFTYRIVSDHLARMNLSDHPAYGYLPLLSFLAVKRHHANLGNLKDEVLSVGDSSNALSVVKRQLDSIDPGGFDPILAACPKVGFDLAEFRQEAEDLAKKRISRGENRRWRGYCKSATPDLYLLFQFLYSALLNADKRDAIGMSATSRAGDYRPLLAVDLVDRYRAQKFKGKRETNQIDPLRNRIYDEVTGAVGGIDLQNRVYSINVPTGTGKTLTALSFALKLRAKISEMEGFVPRIIYCLPFLSIIDQNFSVFEDIFRVVEQRRPDSNILLKHHHLAEIAFRFAEDEVAPPDESLFLIEGWESEIVVTTFMQLFHTLVSNKNRMLRKFNAMVNAIVILDEVQTIPYKYWHLVRMLFLRFASLFHSRFIFMTATQPLIFQREEITELVSPETKTACFDALDRITFINRSQETLTLDDFKTILRGDLAAYPRDSFLVVLNTINCSIDVFENIQNYVKEENLNEVDLFYLSTNIIPKHRLKRIRAIKKSPRRKVIVSTQLVEAGVDIDVDRVYRDFAPLDSLNQVAGRCNRNFTLGRKGVVTLFSLRNSHEFYKYIYGRGDLTISKTIDVLSNKTELSEKEFLNLGLDYFERLKDSKSDDASELILDLLSELSFHKACEDNDNKERFRLIESEYPTRDLFIEFDQEAVVVWRLYEEARLLVDPVERKRQINQIKKDLYSYIISVPVQKAPGRAVADWEIVYVNQEQVKSCYNKQTGFIREDPGSTVF